MYVVMSWIWVDIIFYEALYRAIRGREEEERRGEEIAEENL